MAGTVEFRLKLIRPSLRCPIRDMCRLLQRDEPHVGLRHASGKIGLAPVASEPGRTQNISRDRVDLAKRFRLGCQQQRTPFRR